MINIAIVSNNKFKNKITEDINIKNELISSGYSTDIISWEDKSVDYSKYNCLLLRSVWGYQNNYAEFKKWLEYIKNNNIVIFNSPDIIFNNIKKDVQFKILDDNNIEHIDTLFFKEKIDISTINDNQVIKPIISGSGEKTCLKKDYNPSDYEDVFSEEDNGLMVQPFIKEIENGEYSIIFIDGKNTHNMMRYPGIFSVKNKPYEITDVPNKVLDLANRVNMIPEYKDALYMRVDIVDKENPKVMEVELAEPDLLTRNLKSIAPIKVLCKGLVKKLK